VKVDCYLPAAVTDPTSISLLLINDGQDMDMLGLQPMLEDLYSKGAINPVLCVGIHASEERKMEYGTMHVVDYKGRGAKAGLYTTFILDELIPFILDNYLLQSVKEKCFAGFSLGGLSALDIAWNNPEVFSKVGVFSGSLWWRKKGIEDGYDEATDRIMHAQVREGQYVSSMKFFLQTGTQDESMDRNNNGIIDSIDDSMALIDELVTKGYNRETDIAYLELEGGKHDVPTWSLAMPYFLKWGFPRSSQSKDI
jgi:enterochelin esterase-like enzyme